MHLHLTSISLLVGLSKVFNVLVQGVIICQAAALAVYLLVMVADVLLKVVGYSLNRRNSSYPLIVFLVMMKFFADRLGPHRKVITTFIA